MTMNTTYAFKLLFHFRVKATERPGTRRICEERIIHVKAADARKAVDRAKRFGRKAEHKYVNSDQQEVKFGFVGIIDMIRLGPECSPEEVWYDIVRRSAASIDDRKMVPSDRDLIRASEGRHR